MWHGAALRALLVRATAYKEQGNYDAAIEAMVEARALFGLGFGALAALVTQAPAAWLGQTLSQASQSRVLLQDARGSVWRGDAQVLLGAGPRAPGPALARGNGKGWQVEAGGA